MRRARWFIMIALIASTPLAAQPVMRKRSELPPEIQSLAGLRRISVDVVRIPELLREHGITKERMLDVLTERLDDAGFMIRKPGEDMPSCVMRVSGAIDPAQPEALSIYIVVGVRQKVHVHRIDKTLLLPTASVNQSILTTRDRARDAVESRISSMANLLGNVTRKSTEAKE